MHFEITARHAPVSDDVKTHVHDRLEHVLRHANDLTSVHVVLDHEKTRHVCEVIVHGRRLSATVHADSDDVYLAIDRCAEKLRHQLDHHHGRIRDKRRRAGGLAEAEVEAAAIAASLAAAQGIDEPEGGAAAAARVVRQRTDPKPMTEADARRQLAASDEHVLVFRDWDTDEVCILYKRPDGAFGLVETGTD